MKATVYPSALSRGTALSTPFAFVHIPKPRMVANGPWHGSDGEGTSGRSVSPLATQAGLPGSEPPDTRRVDAHSPPSIRRQRGSVYFGESVSSWSVCACSPTFSASHVTVEPSALIDAGACLVTTYGAGASNGPGL